MEDLKLDRPVPVHDAVAKPRRLLPADLRETGLHLDINLCGRLAEHREVPEQRVTPLTVVAESNEISPGDE